MRTLTVRQPYAHWMFTEDPVLPEFGLKTIENRPWACDYRGDLAIHAALRPDPSYKGSCWLTDDMIYGAIIGIVQLVDIHVATINGCQGHEERCSVWSDYPTGPGKLYHWQLADPHLLEVPITVRGQLGLWNYAREEAA